MGAEAAGEAADGLRAKGADALMSFGFAGALEPGLNSGDLVLPESVYAGHLLDVDLSWRDSLCRRLPNHFTVAGGILAASNGVLTTDISKRELARATGARAVDMESGAVAEVAAYGGGIPFLAVRAISDTIEFSPPSALLNAVRPDGSADLIRLLMLLLQGSLTLGTLQCLAAGSRAACSTLSAVTRYAGMEMGIIPDQPVPPLGSL